MKQKRISKEEYAKRYCCEKRIRNRKVLYVSQATHEEIHLIASVFKDDYVTVMSLTDAILRFHIKEHKDLLEPLVKKDREMPSINENADESEEKYEEENESD